MDRLRQLGVRPVLCLFREGVRCPPLLRARTQELQGAGSGPAHGQAGDRPAEPQEASEQPEGAGAGGGELGQQHTTPTPASTVSRLCPLLSHEDVRHWIQAPP